MQMNNKTVTLEPLSDLEVGLVQTIKDTIQDNVDTLCARASQIAEGKSWPFIEYNLYAQCVAATAYGLVNSELDVDISLLDGQVTRITNKVQQAVMDIVLNDLKENNQL